MTTDATLCEHLRAGDLGWFLSDEGQAALAGVRLRLTASEASALDLALYQKDMNAIDRVLYPVVCNKNGKKKEDKEWLIPAVLLVLGLLFLCFLLWWLWDTFQESTKDPEPTASPTVSAAPVNPTFAVLFNPGETVLDSTDQVTITNAEKQLDEARELTAIHIIGRADGTGVPAENQAIAQARADVVKNDIVADGYKDIKITVTTEMAPVDGTPNQRFRSTDIILK